MRTVWSRRAAGSPGAQKLRCTTVRGCGSSGAIQRDEDKYAEAYDTRRDTRS